MKSVKRFLVTPLGACSMVAMLLVIPARGQGLDIEKGPYLNFGAGLNWMSADFDADTGFRLSAAAGYNFNKWVGLELESGFLYNRVNTQSRFGGDSVGQMPLLLNFVLRYENESKLVPYVGFGLGGDLLFGSGDTSFDFAYQPMFGARYKINEKMSVGLGYKYLGYVSSVIWGFQLGNHGVLIDLNWKF